MYTRSSVVIWLGQKSGFFNFGLAGVACICYIFYLCYNLYFPRLKLTRLEHIFITHKSWANLGGMIGELISAFIKKHSCVFCYLFENIVSVFGPY